MLYVMRHGQTNGNLYKIMHGLTDFRLNLNGIHQVIEKRDYLKNIDFYEIYASPLTRTKETAEIVNIKNKKIIYDYRLIERDVGELTGTNSDFINKAELWNIYSKKKFRGESVIEVIIRVTKFLEDIKEQAIKNNILIVTHDGVIKVIDAYFYGIPKNGNLKNYGSRNAEISIYKFKK